MTTVLFGAGAESSFGLANGKQFSFNVLGVGNDSLNSALRKYYVDVLEVKHNAVRTTQIPISLNNTGVSDTRRTLWFEDRKWHLCDENGNNNIQISNLLNKVSFKLKNQNSPSTILLPNRSYLDYFANGKEYTIM